MATIRLIVTTVYEYEINPEHHDAYDNCETDQERMELDIQQYNENPTMLEMMDCKSMSITGTIIDSEE